MKKAFFQLALALSVYLTYYFLRNELSFLGSLGIKLDSESLFIFILGIIVLCVLDYSFGNVHLKLRIPAFSRMLNAISFVIFEEILFRAILLNVFRYLLSDLASVIITSIIFGICHKQRGLNYIYVATVAGLFYSYSFLLGNIELSAAQHLVTNVIRYLIFSNEKQTRSVNVA